MHSPAELMEAIERLEVTIYGDPSRDKRGLVERQNATEAYVDEIRTKMDRIFWLLVAGVVGAVLNLVLNTRNIAVRSPAPTEQIAKP